MKFDNYINNTVLKFKSDKVFPELVPVAALKTIVDSHIASSRMVDQAKKSLFYGKSNPGLAGLIEATMDGREFDPDYDDMDKIHAILGIMTEAVELGELLNSHDAAKFIDELGDLLWYVALLTHVVGVSLEEVLEANNRKLEARYKDQFSPKKAISRDIQIEDKAIRAK